MRKWISRILSCILTAAMVLTAVPADVYASGTGSHGEDIILDIDEAVVSNADPMEPSDESITEEGFAVFDDSEEISETSGLVSGYDSSKSDRIIEENSEDSVSDDESEKPEVHFQDNMLNDDVNETAGKNTKFTDAQYFVVSANAVVEYNNKSNYLEDTDDGAKLYDDYLTGSALGDRELFSAFYNDMLFERQGGKWYTGFDVINYNASPTKVYDRVNYEKFTSEDPGVAATAATLTTKPAFEGSDGMVFLLDNLPAQLSENYKFLVWDRDGNSYDYKNFHTDISGEVKLYAWEYERNVDGRYTRKKVSELTPDDYELYEDEEAVYTNEARGDGSSYFETETLSGAVKLNSQMFTDPDNPIAIVAMLYDAAANAGSVDAVKELTRYGATDIWENDLIFGQLADDHSKNHYFTDLNNYWDDMYSAEAMGDFSLRAYTYYIDQPGSTIYLYGNDDLTLYNKACADGYLSIRYGDIATRDWEKAEEYIDKWEIPGQLALPNGMGPYKVALGDVIVPDDASVTGGIYCRNLYPGMAKSLVIDYGVTFPANSSGLLVNGMEIDVTESFEIKGQPASVGGGKGGSGIIEDLRYFAPTKNKLVKLDIAALDTSHVTDMSHMFENVFIKGTSTAANVDVSHFDTSKVTDFERMFAGYQVKDPDKTIGGIFTKLDLSGWNTSNAVTMAHMFDGMRVSGYEGADLGILDLSGFEFTNKLTNMQGMFADHAKETGGNDGTKGGLYKIVFPANMDTTKVTDMSYLFAGDEDLEEIVNFTALDTDSVEDMSDMFGAMLTSRNVETKDMGKTYMDEGSWIYYLKNEVNPGLNVTNPTSMYVPTGRRGVLLDSLDLSNFNTKKVRYAYGMFYGLPNLDKIKWGSNTTFESLTDATHMFVLPAMTEFDLTGRKFSSLKYAHNMIDLDSASEITFGSNSLDLSNISQYGRFSVSAPVLSVDFTNVPLSVLSFDEDSLINNHWTMYNTAPGLSEVEELIFPANMPAFTYPPALRTTFFDEEGNSYDYVTGGNAAALKLTTSAAGNEITGIEVTAAVAEAGNQENQTKYTNPGSLDLDLNAPYRYYDMALQDFRGIHAIFEPQVYLLDPSSKYTPDISWVIDQDALSPVFRQENDNDTLYLTAQKAGNATVKLYVDEDLTYSCEVRVYDASPEMITAAGGTIYKGVKLGDGTYKLTGCQLLNEGSHSFDLTQTMRIGTQVISISSIGNRALAGQDASYESTEWRDKITTVKIPASVKYIENEAFYNLGKVSRIEFAEGSALISIGSNAFSYVDYNLDSNDTGFSVDLSKASYLESIDSEAFGYNKFLTGVTLPDSVTFLGSGAFKECPKLASVRLSEGLTAIPDELFRNSGSYRTEEEPGEYKYYGVLNITNIGQVMLNVTSVGEKAFYSDPVQNAESLRLNGADIFAPNLTSIGDHAFYNTGITSFAAPVCTVINKSSDSVTDPGSTFSDCPKLASVSFPSLKTVPFFAFAGCKALRSVDMLSLLVIEKGAFTGTKALASFAIPDRVTTIGDNAFAESGLTSVKIPSSVRTIGKGAYSNTNISSIVIPDNVTSIGESVFADCSKLESVAIGNGITEIPAEAFAGTATDLSETEFGSEKIKFISFGDNVASIGKNAFRGATLDRVNIPSSAVLAEGAYHKAFIGSVNEDGQPVAGGISTIEIPYGITEIPNYEKGYISPFATKQNNNRNTYIEELYLPGTVTNLDGFRFEDLFRRSSTDKLEYTAGGYTQTIYRYEGKIYYPGSRRELEEAVFAHTIGPDGRPVEHNYNRRDDFEYGEYNLLDLFDIEYGTGWKEVNGKPVFYKNGELQTAQEGGCLVQNVGDAYYLIDENGSYLTDTVYVGSETEGGNTKYYIYLFDASGAGERHEITQDEISAGSSVYGFFNDTAHGAMKTADGIPGAVKSAGDVPSASTLSALHASDGGHSYYAYSNGVLAKGVVEGEGRIFCFDDFDQKDGRLVWYAVGSGDDKAYYSGVPAGNDKLLGGSEGVTLPDEKGVIVTFKNGKKVSLEESDLTVSADPSVLYVGTGSGSGDKPDTTTLTLTVNNVDAKELKMEGAGASFAIVQNFPRVSGTKVVTLGDVTELTGNTASVVIKASASGTAKIRALFTDGDDNKVYKDYMVTVKELDPVPTGMTLTASSYDPIPNNGTVTLTASLEPAGTDFKEGLDKISWSAEPAGLVLIQNNGNGTATVTGQYEYMEGQPQTKKVTVTASTRNGIKKRITLTVTNKTGGQEPDPGPGPGPSPTPTPVPDEMDVTGVTLNKNEMTMYEGESFKLSASISPAGAGDKSVAWTSSDTDVATVDGGKVTAVKAGTDASGKSVAVTVTITATANGAAPGNTVKAECIVTVLPSEIVEKGADDKPITPAAGQAFVTEDDGKGEARIWVAGLDNTGYHYTGNAIKPEIHVYKGYKLLTEKTDYTLSYKNNKNVSKGITEDKKKPQIIIKMKGDYSGSETVYFNIIPMPLENLTADNDVFSTEYKAGKKNQSKPNLMYKGKKVKYGAKDITFKWFTTDGSGTATATESECIDAGTYAVKVFAGESGNYSGGASDHEVAKIIVSDKVPMSKVKLTGFKGSLPYKQGKAVSQNTVLTYKDKSGEVTLKENADYTAEYKDNYDLGTATVTYEAVKDENGKYTGRYSGKVIKTYKITGKYTLRESGDGKNCMISLNALSYPYANAAIKPEIKVTATITNNDGIKETRTLVQGRDYTVSYKNNKAVAAADAKKNGKDIAPQVIIKGKGSYVFADTDMKKGIVKRFAITKSSLGALVLTISDVAYSKKENGYQKTKILFTDKDYRDLKLKLNRDYTAEFTTSDKSSTPAAGQVVTVTLKATENSSYTGSVTGSYRITDKKMHTDISKAKVVVNPNSNGKTQPCMYTESGIEPIKGGNPGLNITIGSGKNLKTLEAKKVDGSGKVSGDYEIIGYYNNVLPGNKAVILIRGIGNYRGIRAVKFKISARGVNTRWGGVYVQSE